MYISFAEIKARYNIEQVSKQLNLTLKQHGEQYRGPCPSCGEGGDRALVITPRMNAFYCFAGKTGGDIIGLASHILGVGPKDAALAIANFEEPQVPVTVPEKSPRGEENDLNPLGHLVIDENVTALLSKEDAEAVGIGFCRKGLMARRIVIPIRTEAGKLVGYAGYSPEDKSLKLPPKGLRL